MVHMNLFAKQKWDTDVDNKHNATKKGREVGWIWDWDIDTIWDGHLYTTIYKTDN